MATKVKVTPTPPGGWSNYILETAKRLDDKYSSRNKILAEVHKRRYMQKAPAIPEVFRATAAEFRSPLIHNFIRQCVSIISTTMPTPRVIPTGIGDTSIKQSSHNEKWLTAAYYKMAENNDIYPMIVDAEVESGKAVWKVLPEKKTFLAVQKHKDEEDEAYLKRLEAHRHKTFPFVWEHIPTSTYYPIDEYGRSEVLEVSQRETLPLARKYNLIPDGNGGIDIAEVGVRIEEFNTSQYPNEIKFYEYWKAAEEDSDGKLIPGTFIYMVGDKIVKQGYHKWLRTPIFTADANTTSSKSVAEKSLSLAYPLLYLQDTLDSLRTIQMNWAYLQGFPAMRAIPKGDDMTPFDDESAVIEYVPGKMIDMPGRVPEWMPAPPVGADLVAMNDFIMDMFNMVSLNPILNGVIPGADVSGVAAQTMISIAKSIFGPGMNNIARAFNDMASFMFNCIQEDFGVPIPVYQMSDKGKGKGKNKDRGEWLELGPDDLQGYYEVRHTLTPVLPAEQMTKSIWLADGNARGFVPKRRVIEEGFGAEAPDEVIEELMLDELRKSPEYRQMIATKWLEALNLNLQPQQPGTPPDQFGPAGGIGPGGPGIPMVAGAQQGYGPGSQPLMPAVPPEAMPPNGAPIPGDLPLV